MSINSEEKVAILHEAADKVIDQRALGGVSHEHHAITTKKSTSNYAMTWHHFRIEIQVSNSSRRNTYPQHFDEKLYQPKRQEVLKQMPLRRSLEALTFALCSLSAIGCSNPSLKFKGPSITYSPSTGSLGASGDKKY